MTHGNEADLTAKARIRRAALALFARNGFAGTSLRAVAARAGVSHALVRHHFGSKEGLRAAVDEDVLDDFDTLMEGVETTDPGELLAAFGGASARLLGTDEVRREYLRRSLLEGNDAGAALFTRLLEGVRTRLDGLRDGPAEDEVTGRWEPYQVLFLILGPMLLEPVMAAGSSRPVFDPDVVAERSRVNQRLIARGILGRT
ncbi:helix-turn-helix domain containing protein [Nocardiopsis sp. N85]|uniref:TetR/AcrR family transcriptional regulator n=1 Tax=Nocardiopsis sp. N85 TaxID=3029400 RepID=UPI00237FBCAB|nr:helix-turn-helix domain-containing protein [Nocardiopsis sp. N85]MDE3725066.1 helix-turn-helix domain containing protein [Nocardiopsis sp. N85]